MQTMLTLIGDGVHDDTDALEALLCGEFDRVEIRRQGVFEANGSLYITGGVYLLHRHISTTQKVVLEGCTFIMTRDVTPG